jgi:hypothetical protein
MTPNATHNKLSTGFLVVVFQYDDSHTYLFQDRFAQTNFVKDIEKGFKSKGLKSGPDFRISMSVDVVTLQHE